MLRRCLQSVPDRNDTEIVIVLDDGTGAPRRNGDIFNGGGRKPGNCTVLSTAENRGAGHARNVGMRAASGTWLIFADSDDVFITENFNAELDRWKDAEEDIVFLDVEPTHTDESIRITENHWTRTYINKAYRYGDTNFIRFQHTTPWGKFIKRRLVERHSITFQEVPYCNDTRFSVNAALAARSVAFSDTRVYRYIVRSDSLTHKSDLDSCLCRFSVQRAYESKLVRRGLGKYRPRVVEDMWLRVFKKDPARSFSLVPSLVASIGVRPFIRFVCKIGKRRLQALLPAALTGPASPRCRPTRSRGPT